MMQPDLLVALALALLAAVAASMTVGAITARWVLDASRRASIHRQPHGAPPVTKLRR